MTPIPYSVLDLAPIKMGSTASEAFQNSLDLARHAEHLGYHRFWLAEHHNMTGIASAATSVVIGHIAAGTSTIRVGAGGIMLPNHAPLVIAEQFGTLESLFPGRIDLGLGRAPGGDQRTARALRRTLNSSGDTFPQDLMELQSYFSPATPGQSVRAGNGIENSDLAAGIKRFQRSSGRRIGIAFRFCLALCAGLPLSCARSLPQEFQAFSLARQAVCHAGRERLRRRYGRAGATPLSSLQQQFVNLVRGTPGMLPPPVESMEGIWSPLEQAHLERMTAISAVGSPETVREALANLLAVTQADELIATAQIYDHAARLRSFEILAEVRDLISAKNQIKILQQV